MPELTVPPPDPARWLPLAAQQPSESLKLGVPVENLFGEATDLARFVAEFGQPKRDGDKIAIPGLNMANRKPRKVALR